MEGAASKEKGFCSPIEDLNQYRENLIDYCQEWKVTHQSLLDSLESKETLIFQLNDCYEMMSSNWRYCNERCKELETELKSKEQFDQLVSSVNQLAKQDQAIKIDNGGARFCCGGASSRGGS